MRTLYPVGPTATEPDPVIEQEEVAAAVLAKLMRAPDELRAAGASDEAIEVAEEIAHQAARLLPALDRH